MKNNHQNKYLEKNILSFLKDSESQFFKINFFPYRPQIVNFFFKTTKVWLTLNLQLGTFHEELVSHHVVDFLMVDVDQPVDFAKVDVEEQMVEEQEVVAEEVVHEQFVHYQYLLQVLENQQLLFHEFL